MLAQTMSNHTLIEETALPTLQDLDAAARRLEGRVHRTPVLRSATLDRRTGATVFLKCENFQRIGAFKFRGATNAVQTLDAEALRRGVATHSSGNHGQALALAARQAGTHATIVVPETAPKVKLDAIRGYGGEIVLCTPTSAGREGTLARILEERGSVLIHPFDDWRIIAGQATAARELLEETGPLDVVMAPVGGGGLLAGTALTCRHLAPETRVVGAEPEAADDAKRSLDAGSIQPANDPTTLADGLLTALSARTFSVIGRYVDSVALASEAEIVDAMRLVWERLKIIIEPSASVTLAALLAGRLDAKGKRVGVIVTGGNVDLDRLPWL